MDDFFSDLVPIKASNGSKVNDAVGSGAFTDDAVLSALPEPHAQGRPASSTLSDVSTPKVSSPLQPMGEPRQKKDAREMEKTVQTLLESTFKRFAGGLQSVLEDIQRRLDSLEHQSEQVMKALSDVRDVDGLRDDATKERFSAIDKTLRDIQRGVQLVRDKQELLEAHAELAKLSPSAPHAPDAPAVAPSAAEEAPKPMPVKVSAPEKPVSQPAQPAALPAPAPVQAAAPEAPQALPAAPPLPSAPQQQATPFSSQVVQQAPQMPSMPSVPQQVAPQYPGPQAPPPQQPQPQYSAPPAPVPQYSAPPPPQPQYNQAPPQMPMYSAPPDAQHTQYSQAPPPQSSMTPHQYDSYSQLPNAPPQTPLYRPPTPQQQLPRMDSYGPPPPPPPPQAPFSAMPQLGYPSLPRPSPPNAPPPPPPPPPPGAMYGGSYAQPPPAPARASQPPPQAAPNAPTTRSVPLEKVIDDVANMGFSRHEVHAVITELMDNGQSVDLNVVLDRLMNGPRR